MPRAYEDLRLVLFGVTHEPTDTPLSLEVTGRQSVLVLKHQQTTKELIYPSLKNVESRE